MAIALDAYSTDVSGSGTGPFTLSHTVAGTDRALVVVVYGMDNLTTTWAWSSVSFDGVSMTEQAANEASGNTRNVRVAVWTMLNPPVGTYTVSATPSVGVLDAAIAAISLTGVHQSTGVGNANSYGATGVSSYTTSITTGVDDAWLVGGGATRNGTLTWSPGTGVTELFDITGGASTTDDISSFGGHRAVGAAGSYAFASTTSGANNGVIAAVELRPAPSGVTKQFMYYARLRR